MAIWKWETYYRDATHKLKETEKKFATHDIGNNCLSWQKLEKKDWQKTYYCKSFIFCTAPQILEMYSMILPAANAQENILSIFNK